MAYTKKTWVTGETIQAVDLNHLESGVEAISANGAIGTSNLANAAVTSVKIANNSITEDELSDGAVVTSKIEDGAVTRAKLADAALSDIAGEYSSSAKYAVGDYVFHGGALYRCVTAITTAEAWTAAHWRQITLGDDVSDLMSALDDGFESNSYTWQKGGLSSGAITSQLYRAVTTDEISASDGAVLVKNTDPNYKFSVDWTINGTLTNSGWVQGAYDHQYKIPKGATFRICVAKASENYVTLTDVELDYIKTIIYLAVRTYDAYAANDFNKTASVEGQCVLDPTDFIVGTYYSGGSYYKDTARVCSMLPMSLPFKTRFHVKSGYRFAVQILDSQGSVVSTTSFGTVDIVIHANTPFRLVIDNGNTSATANVHTYASQLTYRSALGMEVDKANEIGERYYSGINIKPKQHGFYTKQTGWSHTSPTTPGTFTPQAMSYYNGVLFKCWKDDLIQLYNFSTNALIAEYTLTSGHGDCMDFSGEFYDADDEFPLAYFTADSTPCKVYVNRLTRSGATLIRTLKFDESDVGYYAAAAVDAQNNRLVMLGYAKNAHESNADGTNYMICTVWDLSDLTENDDTTYTPNRLKSFCLPFIATTQDQCYDNNLFFVVSSKATSDAETVIYVVDVGLESVVAKLSDIPYKTYETEGIFWVDSDMYVNGNGLTKYMFT